MNLVRAELSRLAARRFVQLMVVLLISAFAITMATTLASSHQPTSREIAQAQSQAEQRRLELETVYPQCLAEKRSGAIRQYRYAPDCEQLNPDRVHSEDFLYRVFVFEREIRPLMYFLVAFLALFGFLVGASYIGAELHSGGMTNLLLWRPQRLRVLGAKLATLLGGVLAVSVVSAALYLGAYWAIAQTSGMLGHLDGEFWRWMGLTAARGGALVLAVTAVGFSVATLGRHTAAALGVVAAYGVIWEVGARIVMDMVQVGRAEQWMLSTYTAAWMTGQVHLWDRSACTFVGSSGTCTGAYTLTWAHAALVLGVVVVAFLIGAFANFRRRDLI